MKETLKYIGRWVIRFILMSIIFSTFQSCAKAYTFDEFVTFSETVTELDEADTDTHLAARWLVSNADRIRTELSSTINNFDSFVVWYTSSGSFYRFIGYQGGNFRGWNYSSSTGIINNEVSRNGRSQGNGTWWTYIDGRSATFRYGLFNETIAENIDFTGRIGNNYFKTNTYYLGHMHSQPVTYSGEQLEAITLNYNFRSTFIESVVCEDTIITSMHATLDNIELECNNLGTYWNLVCPNSTLLKVKQIYTLNVESVIDGEIETLTERLIFFPPGTLIENGVIIRSPSGDYIFNTENATNQIIDNQNNLFNDLYNKMFTVSGEQIQQIINTTMENVKIPSGEIAEIEQIFNYLSGDAGDFIISWTDKTTHFTLNGANITQMTLPAKQINFSEMERQSPELQQAMHWARLITNISIFSILIHEAYICLLATLGVPVAIYGQKLEEKAQLAAQQQKHEQAWQNRLEQQRYNEWLYSHRKR